MTGFGIFCVPRSWALGRWAKKNKTLWAFGPFRFHINRNLGKWGAP